MRKEILYPIFLECCQHIDDTFWENVFEDLSYGKSLYGTYISKNFLCCGYRKKEFSYKIETKDPKIIYNEVYSLLTKRLGLLSPQEKLKKLKVFKDIEKGINESRIKWANIRKKNLKELLIELFVTRMKNKHSLSIKQARYLLSIILISVVFKVIRPSDIDYSNGKINAISGIDFTHKNVIISHGLKDVSVSFAPHVVVDKKTISDNWEKYLDSLRKITGKK